MSADIKVTDGTILEALNNKVDIDFDNVASNSVSFARMSREVTNCITEIPQRIKYTLENGTLTIKAGSVVIVPYGVEDLTAQYPVGATFINDNFKVYDTQFADGKFFVWAELVNDSVNITSSDSSTSERLMFINLTQFKVNVFLYSGSGTTDYTGSLNYALYRTDQNIMKRYSSGSLTGDVYCLPTAKVTADGTYTIGSVDQVFNGMGYIGSIKWLDTGVVGLATNGKNADGSLNNIEWKRNSILLKDVGANKDAEYIDIYTVDGLWYSTLSYTVSNTEPTIKTSAYWWYNPSTNEHFRSNGTNWVKMNATVIGSFSKVDGSIVSFTTKQPFRAVDYNDLVKANVWIPDYRVLSSATAVGNYTIDLSTKLPDDGHMYEILVSYRAYYEGDSYSNGLIHVTNEYLAEWSDTLGYMTSAGDKYQEDASACGVIPIGASRSFTLKIKVHGFNSMTLAMHSYRKLGKY